MQMRLLQKEALNDFMSEMDSIQKQYGESDVISSMIDRASGGLTEVKRGSG